MQAYDVLRALAAGAACAFALTAAAAPDVAMFRGGPEHLGVYDSSPPALGSVRWRFRTRGPVRSSPAVAGGIVYAGSGDGAIYAVRAADGTKVWSFATKGAVTSSPAVDAGLVVAASTDGAVYALDAATGTKRWAFTTGGERRFTAPGIHGLQPRREIMPDPFDMFTSSPAIAGGTVFIGSGDHKVYALDLRTGAQRWSFTTGDVVHATPAVVNGTVYVGSWDRNFYALDAATGAVRWRFQTGDDQDTHNQIGIVGSAAVSRGTVYFGARDAHFYALDAATGRVRWTRDHHGSWVISSPAISGDDVVYTTSDEKKLYALDARTGAVRYTVPQAAFSYSSPAIAHGMAYYGAFDGRVSEVDVRTGRVTAQFETDAAREHLRAHLTAAGVVDPATLYDEPTLDGIIVGLYRFEHDLGAVIGSPAIAGGVLYVGSGDGTLYAVG